jgi:hypothetical protein
MGEKVDKAMPQYCASRLSIGGRSWRHAVPSGV